MIYAKCTLGLAILGTTAAGGTRNLGSGSSIPSKTCLTESQCNKQRIKMGIPDVHYYINNFHHHGCFEKNNKVFWGRGGSDADKATSPLPGIQERVWCDGDWKDEGYEKKICKFLYV